MSEDNEVTMVNSEREKDFSFEYPPKPVTNGDRIRAIWRAPTTDEEIAEICEEIETRGCPQETDKCTGFCKKCWLNWLCSPVNDGGDKE